MIPPVLKRMIAKKTIPHALLFTGGGREDVAEAFMQEILQTQAKWKPDLHRYYPEGKNGLHAISQIRSLINDVAFFSYEGQWKVFIIYEAERMLPTSSNALLKTLEEPTPNTVILLLSENPDAILPTIRSRSQVFFFPSLEIKGHSSSQALLIQLLCSSKKDYLFLRSRIQEICREKEKGEPLEMLQEGSLLLQTILEWARDLLALVVGSTDLIHKEFRTTYETYLASNPLPDLFALEKKVKDAKTCLERSIKLSTCLESLLIQI